MQQLTYLGPQKLEWQDVPRPKLCSDIAALVRPIAVARCDLDLYVAMGAYKTPGPFAFGHEMTAVVEEVGDCVVGFVPGDRVIVPFQIHCGSCDNCKRGWTNACKTVSPFAAYGLGTHPSCDYGGAFSDTVLVPYADAMLVILPDSISAAAGAGLSDNVADGYRTVAGGLREFPCEPVLVVGGLAQSVGLYAVHAALALGSRRVVYADSDNSRLGIAKRAGAETIILSDMETQTRHEDDFLIVVDASATREGLMYAMGSTAPCGFCTSVSGGLSKMMELPLSSAYMKGINYQVSRVHSRTVLNDTLHHACQGTINPLVFVDDILSFDDCIDAMLDPRPKLIFCR
jgi:threonine dehydrogenase-like Zn-dependent dehydrogenase